MKNSYRILSFFMALMFIFCGCGKKNETKVEEKKAEKILPSYSCVFPFDNLNTFVSVTKNGEVANVSNGFDNMALSLYNGLKTDNLTSIDKPKDLKDNDFILIYFGSLSEINKPSETPEFKITSDDVLVFVKDNEEQYFKAVQGTFSEISAKCDLILTEKNAYFKENAQAEKKTISLLKKDGSVAKDTQFDGKVFLVKKNVLLLKDIADGTRRFFDREKAMLSGSVSEISDYCDGYLCFAEEKQIKLVSVVDKNFSYSGNSFERKLSDSENPFVSLVLNDKNSAEITYYTDLGELYSQKYDLSAFFKDYEDKKAKAKANATTSSVTSNSTPKTTPKTTPKPNPPANTNKYEYISPSFSTANGIPPFSPEFEAKLMKLDNTKKGYGWKGSEARQDYYSKFNAYATGDRNKNTVYLTFDEGYEYNENTSKILDVLASKNVKAVFFVTMDFAKKRPDLVRRMIDEGHTVGNHSTTHPSFPTISLENGYNEILNLHNYILNNFGYSMNLFRFPEGASSERTLALVSEMGYASVFWNCAYNDWDTSKQPSYDTTRALVANNTQNGTIYLFHAVSNTNVAMLGEIIDTVRQAGYEFGLFGKS